MAAGTLLVLFVLSIVETGAVGFPPALGSGSAGSKPMNADFLRIAEGNNRFATELYARLRDQSPGNLFFSPYSIYSAMAMTCAGAAGQTRKQMAEVLHFSLPEGQLDAAFGRLKESILGGHGKEIRLCLANRLWGQAGYRFLPQYLETARKDYGAALGTVDFARNTEEARRQINAWVEQQTEEKIKDLLPPGVLDAQTRLVLTNAIYFKGAWQDKFDKNATQKMPFHLSADLQAEVPMMHQIGTYGYRAFDTLQVLELPYAGGSLSMLVFLPKEIAGLAELEKNLTAESLREWTRGLRRHKVSVFLPRFQMTSQFGLKDALVAMGMRLPFEPGRADFSGMSTADELFLSAVVHKAYVEVSEEGTEAAAATGAVVGVTSLPFGELTPPTFRADHPFAFAVRDNASGSLLFLGRVVSP